MNNNRKIAPQSAVRGDVTPHNHTDAPNFGHHAHRATRSSVALPLPAAGEEKFCPKSAKTTQKSMILGVPLRVFGRATGMDIEILGSGQKQRPRQNDALDI